MNFIPKAAAGPPGRAVRTDEITVNDVLCGRGGDINVHVGNERYRKMIEIRKMDYLTATYKREKRMIASSIVNEIHALVPPGRFMSKIQAPGRKRSRNKGPDLGWFEIGEEKAIEKASQALRENAPSIRKQIGQESKQCVEATLTENEGLDDDLDESYALIKPEQPCTSSDYPSKFPTGSLQRLPCGALQQVPSSSASNQQNLSSSEDTPSTDAPSSPFESFLAEMLDNTKPSAQDFHERTRRSHPASQQPFPCEASSQQWPLSASSCDRATLSIMQDYAHWFPHPPSVPHHQVTGSFSFDGSFPEVSCSSNYNIQDPLFHQRAASHSVQQNSHAAGANSYHRAHGAMTAEATKPGATNGASRISSYEDRSQRKRIKISSSQTSSFPLSPIRLLRETLPSYPVHNEQPNYSYYANGNNGGSFGQQHPREQYDPFNLFIENFPSINNLRPTNAASNGRQRTSHQDSNTNRSFDFAHSSQQLRTVSNSAEQGEDYDSFHSLS